MVLVNFAVGTKFKYSYGLCTLNRENYVKTEASLVIGHRGTVFKQ